MPIPCQPDPHTDADVTNDPTLVAVCRMGLDIIGLFPRAIRGFWYMYVTINKFIKWTEATPVVKINKQSAVKFIKSIVYRFGVATGPSSPAARSKHTARISASKSAMCPLLIERVMDKSRELMLKSSMASKHAPMTA
jgi:hypothetical protein